MRVSRWQRCFAITLLAGIVYSAGAVESSGALTIYNRTPYPMHVSVGAFAHASSVMSLNQDSPGEVATGTSRVWSKGHWQINPYGGSVTLDWTSDAYIRIEGNGFIQRSTKFDHYLPRKGEAYNFFYNFGTKPGSQIFGGELKKVASPQGYQLERFAHANDFRRSTSGPLEILEQHLSYRALIQGFGWIEEGDSPLGTVDLGNGRTKIGNEVFFNGRTIGSLVYRNGQFVRK